MTKLIQCSTNIYIAQFSRMSHCAVWQHLTNDVSSLRLKLLYHYRTTAYRRASVLWGCSRHVARQQQSSCRRVCCVYVEQRVTICRWTSGADVEDLPRPSLCHQPGTEVPGRTNARKQPKTKSFNLLALIVLCGQACFARLHISWICNVSITIFQNRITLSVWLLGFHAFVVDYDFVRCIKYTVI